MIASNMWPLKVLTKVFFDSAIDLVFDPCRPSFKHDLTIIKMNILNKIHGDKVFF